MSEYQEICESCALGIVCEIISYIDENFEDQELFDEVCYYIANFKRENDEIDFEAFREHVESKYWDVMEEWGETLISIEKYYDKLPDYSEYKRLLTLI